MPGQDFRDPRTADHNSSIWLETPEETLRRNVVQLEECTNAVPIDPQSFRITVPDDVFTDGPLILSIATEQQLANDFAAIAAVEEGAQSVSAVCIEQHINQPGITIRFAAVDTINEPVQTALSEVANILIEAASRPSPEQHAILQNQLFTLFVTQHHRRILGRLRSIKWQKPTYLSRSHKKPLWQDFANLIHRVSFLYTKRESLLRDEIIRQVTTLSSIYQSFETTPPETDILNIQSLILASYDFCTSSPARNYFSRLSSNSTPTSQVASTLKSLHQIEKLAAYIRIPKTLLEMSQSHPRSLSKINLAYLTPYSSVPTSIAYESWAKTAHVHAEVQLAVYYDLLYQSHSQPQLRSHPENSLLRPRVIGTSKHLCYLCLLFLRHHSNFNLHRTHGRLYDQWTIPDLADFSDSILQRYRDIIAKMDGDVLNLIEEASRGHGQDLGEGRDEIKNKDESKDGGEGEGEGKREAKEKGKIRGRKATGKKWRVEPMTSREDLLCLVDG